MKHQPLWENHILTLVFLVVIVVGVGATAFLTGKGIIFNSGAASSIVPHDIHISNITDNSITISYITDSPVIGSISLGTSRNLGKIIFDDRDNDIPKLHTIHTFSVKDLLPSTTYYYAITSGNTAYTNNEAFYTATTGPPLTDVSSLNQLISGSIALPSGVTAGEVIVYIQPANGQLLSTLLDNQAHYVMLLKSLRTNDLTHYDNLNPADPISIIVNDGISQSHILTTVFDASSVPSVALSEDYTFISNNNYISPTTHTASEQFPTFPAPLANTLSIPTILFPKHNQAYVDQQPQFSGIAMPRAIVKIVIHSSDIIQTQVTADSNGDWSYRPDSPLSPGDHTISVSTLDPSGTMQTLTQTFSIFPVGTQVFQTATPSATATPTVTSSPTPTIPKSTLTPTKKPITLTPSTNPVSSTPTPTITSVTTTPTVTPSPTITPTFTPTPTQILLPSPTRQPLPPTGNPFIFPLGIASIIATIAGTFLLIL